MLSKYLQNERRQKGFTLVETIQALMIFSFITLLSLSTLFFFNHLKETESNQAIFDSAFEKLQVYFQRQIDCSEKIYISGDRVYLQDMESPQYYDYYELKEEGTLYRVKCGENLKSIGNGAISQLASEILTFSFRALRNEKGELTGNFQLKVGFFNEEKKEYEAVFAFPGGTNQIFSQ